MHVQSCWVFSIFFFAKNVRKYDENVHRVKKVFTSLGQIQHGGELL